MPSHFLQSIVLNLAVSNSFQKVDYAALQLPAEYRVDYIRVWQRKGLTDDYRTCDPPSEFLASW